MFYRKYGKRIFDIIVSAFSLVILSPLFLIISICIKIDSKGPIFFKQERLGKNGKIFTIYKFRTMVENAENIGDGLVIKTNRDDRVTKIGRILRKTSLDELPQLLNVFKGDMSIVGPRPPVVYHPYNGYNQYPHWAKKRFSEVPGITGLAQVEVRNSASWDERILIDNNYVSDVSLLRDVKIIIQTIYVSLLRKNIYKSEN